MEPQSNEPSSETQSLQEGQLEEHSPTHETTEAILAGAHARVLNAEIDDLLSPTEKTHTQLQQAIDSLPEEIKPKYLAAQEALQNDLIANHQKLEQHNQAKVDYLFRSYITGNEYFRKYYNDTQRDALVQQTLTLVHSSDYQLTDNSVIEPTPGIILLNLGEGLFLELRSRNVINNRVYMAHISRSDDEAFPSPDFIITPVTPKDIPEVMPELRHEVGHTVWDSWKKAGLIPAVHEDSELAPYFDDYRNEVTQYLFTYGYSGAMKMTLNELKTPFPADKPELRQAMEAKLQEFSSLYAEAEQKGIDASELTYFTMTSSNLVELQERLQKFIASSETQDASVPENIQRMDQNMSLVNLLRNRIVKQVPFFGKFFDNQERQDNPQDQDDITVNEVITHSADQLYKTLYQLTRAQLADIPQAKIEEVISSSEDYTTALVKLGLLSGSQEPEPLTVTKKMLGEEDDISTIEDYQGCLQYLCLVLEEANFNMIDAANLKPYLHERLVQDALTLLNKLQWNPTTGKDIIMELKKSEQQFQQISGEYESASLTITNLLTNKGIFD